MSEKTEVSKSFEGTLEEVRAHRDATFAIKNELLSEMERFRVAMGKELRERRRKIDLHDVIAVSGLAMIGAGLAVALHWAYSLIVMGSVFVGLSMFTLLRRPPGK